VAGAVVLAVLVGIGLFALTRPRSSDVGYNPSATGTAAGSHGRSTGTASTGRTQKGAAGTSPSQTPAVDPCLVGTWIVTLQQVTNFINTEPIQFAGDNGLTVVVRADGQVTESWSNAELTAEVGGNDWEEIINGTASYDLKTEGTQMIFSNQSVSGSYKLLENGSYNNGGQLTLEQGNATYSCSAGSIRESTPNGESAFIRAS
jgi:hypothetical protein